ncbi:MAG: hypothetical protein Q4C70_15245, partial [Planctomycetia bacterium]|nr:hypothetical protein [Planctomycetia bacterium]
MKAKTIVSTLFMMGAMMTAPLFAQSGCGVAAEASCGSCSPCVVVTRPKCDLFSGLRCRPVCAPVACAP